MAPSRQKLIDEVRQLAKGWRWGRRMVVPRSAEPYAPPRGPKPYPTDWARTRAGRMAREALLQLVMRPIAWNETSPEVFGMDNLDALDPPVMFVSNHTSHLDATLIMITLPHAWREKTAVAAAKDYFFDVWWRSVFTTLVYAGVPIERGAGERATQKVRELVSEGWSIVLFPEGTRSTDGWVRRFQHGTARLAIELQIPVVPIAIVGAYQAMPKGRNWPIQ